MRKGMLLGMLFLIVSLCVYGCGKEKNIKKPVIIKYGTWEVLPEQIGVLKDIIGMFEEKHPGIRVELELAAGAGGTRKILTQMAAGTAPDVFFWGNQRLPLIAAKGQVLDLTAFFERDEGLVDNYFDEAIDGCRYKGRIYAFPHAIGVFGLYYNKTLFDEAGVSYPDGTWTRDDYLRAAVKLTEDTDGDGRIDRFGTMIPEKWYAWVVANGGRLFDKDGVKCLMDSPETLEILRFFRDLRCEHHVVPSPGQMTEMGGCGGIELFTMGKVAMFAMGSFATVDFARNIKDFDWAISPLPKSNTGRPTTYSMACNCISSQTRHPEEAWKFVKFYAGRDAELIMARRKYNVPSLKSVVDVYTEPPPEGLNVFVEAVEYAQPDWPVEVINFRELSDTVFNPEIDLVFIGKKTPEEAVKAMVKKTNEFLSK